MSLLPRTKRIFSFLRLFIAVLVFFSISTKAYSVTKEKIRISLNVTNDPLEEVLRKIELQSHFNFFYENNTINLKRLVTLKVENQSIDLVLSKVFNKKIISYKVIKSLVVIKRNKKIQLQKIQGKVIDKTSGETIPYCNITVTNSHIGTSTNEIGEFEVRTDSLPTEITFSHINYQKQTISILDTKEALVVELIPVVNVLEEIVLVSSDENDKYATKLAKRAYRKISSETSAKKKYGRAFYRQKTKNNDDYSEFSEIIFDIQYNNSGILKWDIQEGRYAINEEKVNNKNFTKFTQILKSFQPPTHDIIFPLHPNLDRYYNVTIDNMIHLEKDKVAILKFIPKKKIKTPIFEGEAYVNTSTNEVLKITGFISHDKDKILRLSEKESTKKKYQLSYEIVFKKDSLQNSILDYIKVDQKFDYYKNDIFYTHVSSTSNLTFFEHYIPSSGKKLGGQFKRNKSDWGNLDKIGYNKQFWENNPIVKRDPVENEIIEAFEKKNAFESIFLNGKNKIEFTQSNISEDLFIKELDNSLNNYNKHNPIEKVYLHTDKDIINAGNDLWYSAFTVLGPLHYYSAASKVLHVTIVDRNNKIIFYQKQKLYDGTSNGHITIPKDIPSDYYQLRAYTDWMERYDPDFVFKKTIKVNHQNLEVKPIKIMTNNVDLQFFPEGGNSVAGLIGIIAFKAIGNDGLGKAIQGKIIDNQGNDVTLFKSNNRGIGSFSLTPKAGTKYKAILNDDSEYPLPEILASGYNVRINNIFSDFMRIRIQASKNLNDAPFFLIGSIRNQKCFQGKYSFNGSSFVDLEVPKNRFPSGVMTFTLFDKNMKPWCERIVFINNQKELVINTSIDANTFKKKGKATVKIHVSCPDGTPVSANLSMSINNSSKYEKNDNMSNILTYFLLESDIKGHVQNPNQFFKDQKRSTKYNLDLIMLTHGWRRFKWQQHKNHESNKKLSFAQGFKISGFARGKKGALLTNTSLHLIVKSENEIKMHTTKTDVNGHFKFDNLDYIGPIDLSFSAYKENKKLIKVHVSLDPKTSINLVPQLPTMTSKQEINVSTMISKQEINVSKNNDSQEYTKLDLVKRDEAKEIILEEVVVKKDIKRKKSSSSVYGVEPDDMVYVKNTDIDLLQVINKLSGINVTGNFPVARVRVRGSGNPLWVIDGMPIAKEPFAKGTGDLGGIVSPTLMAMIKPSKIPKAIFSLDVQNIERVEVLKGAKGAVFGFSGSSGVIAIYTKRGSYSKSKINTSHDFTSNGFSKEKEFYSPKYNIENDKNNNTGLFWNGSIITDKNGNATVEFPISKKIKKAQVVITGLSFLGIPGAYLETF